MGTHTAMELTATGTRGRLRPRPHLRPHLRLMLTHTTSTTDTTVVTLTPHTVTPPTVMPLHTTTGTTGHTDTDTTTKRRARAPPIISIMKTSMIAPIAHSPKNL